jgi:Pilus formation protein N terminal region
MARISFAGIAGLSAGAAMALALATQVVAGTVNMSIESDKSGLVKISAKPGTVVIGNPSIADVSINGNDVFLHGHAFGNTNIMIFDVKGAELLNLNVTVTQSESDAVTLYRGPEKYSMACNANCDYVLQPGDNPDWFVALAKEIATKNTLATGSESNEAKAPTAAQ